jgi:hypothetical protein
MELDPKFPTPPNTPGQEVLPDTITPLTMEEMAMALIAAHRTLFGKDIDRRALCVFLAHTGLETGRWQKLHWYCVGNIKASLAYQGSVYYVRCNEIIDGKLQWFSPYHPQTRFRAVKTPAGGAELYLRFLGLATRGAGLPNRYQAAFDAAEKGDPVGMSDELHHAGYYTANADLYRRAMVDLFAEFLRELPGTLPAMPPAPRAESVAISQPTSGHNKLSNQDIHDIMMLQIPLKVDWDALAAARNAEMLEEDLNSISS